MKEQGEIEKFYSDESRQTNRYMILIVVGLLAGLIKDAYFGYYFFVIPAVLVMLCCIIYNYIPYKIRINNWHKVLRYLILLLSVHYYQLLFRHDTSVILLIPLMMTLGIYFDFEKDMKIILSLFLFVMVLLTGFYISGFQIITFKVPQEYETYTNISNIFFLITWSLFSVYIIFRRNKQLFDYNKRLKEIFATPDKGRKADDGNKMELHYLINNDYNVFYMKFKEFYPLFIHKLDKIAPNLVVEEIKLIILMFLGYNTRQISEITNTTYSSVEAKKHRVRKKLSVPTGLELSDFLKNI